MKIRLATERRRELLERIQSFFVDQLDQKIGELGAQLLIDLFLSELGPSVYNQGVHDAHDFMQEKLLDLEGELHQDDDRRDRAS